MRLRRMALAALATTAVVGGSVAATAAPANAGTGIHVGIVNADGGVYWRSGPDWSTKVAVTSFGVYNGTVVDIDCAVSAGTLPSQYGSTSHLWYHASVFSGPGYGSGWVHDHFMGTPWNVADRKIDGVPWCEGSGGNNPPVVVQPAPSKLGAAYFSPYPLGRFMPSGSGMVIPRDSWSTGNTCSNAKTANVPTYDPNAGRTVTTLAGWSLGRVGTLYELQRFHDRWSTIDYVVMIDPGSYDQLHASCDSTINANNILFEWLLTNPNAELVIFSGIKTQDPAHPSYVGGKTYLHRGIQEVYFAQIRKNDGVRSRVMVCNYQTNERRTTDELHNQMFWNFNRYIDQPRLPLGSCPQGGGYWHP